MSVGFKVRHKNILGHHQYLWRPEMGRGIGRPLGAMRGDRVLYLRFTSTATGCAAVMRVHFMPGICTGLNGRAHSLV